MKEEKKDSWEDWLLPLAGIVLIIFVILSIFIIISVGIFGLSGDKAVMACFIFVAVVFVVGVVKVFDMMP